MACLHVHYYSETLGMPVEMEVILPRPHSGNLQTYPTLYLLHDMGDGHSSWLRKSCVERYVEDLSLAVVMPAGHLGYYSDMQNGKPYFTFITEELPSICENMFPLGQDRSDRFIAGNGIGGYGAMKAGLSASHVFSVAASYSSPIDVMGIVNRLEHEKATDVFGNLDELKGSSHDLYAIVDSFLNTTKPVPEIYLSTDSEDEFVKENEHFYRHLEKCGLQPHFSKTTIGNKGWKQWDSSLEMFLTWLAQNKPSIVKRGTLNGLD
ncbi:alpha/beta hydrolase [Ferdinandcohnia sp. Marseille-Q9671]